MSQPTPRRLVLVVAIALVRPDKRILLAQRPPGKSLAGLWEFPGGKVEPGESPEEALVRELKEELDVTIDPRALQPFAFASHAYNDFHLLMPLYLFDDFRAEARALEGQNLAWANVHELAAYPMPPADAPLVQQLKTKASLQ
jgi:8-oxo-dGTP diphosphatase